MGAYLEKKIIIDVTPTQLRQIADNLETRFQEASWGGEVPRYRLDDLPDGTEIFLRVDQFNMLGSEN